MKTNSLDFDAQALRNRILDLAIRGKLIPQDPNDEPASDLLKKIKAEKAKLVKAKKIKKSKPLPEITDNEKPFDIPSSWEWVRFGNIVSFSIGKTPKRANSLFWDNGNIPWVSISDMGKEKILSSTKEKITNKALTDVFKGNITPTGTLLMSFKLSIGKVCILGTPAVHNEAIISISPILNKEHITRDYLYFLMPLISNESTFTPAIKGKTLNKRLLNNLMVPLPPLSEQSRIAAKIAQLFALLRKVELSNQQYAKLKALLKSKVLDLAMWGKLVSQDPNDEPVSELLGKGDIKLSKEKPHPIPSNWQWIILGSASKFINGRAYKKKELLTDKTLTPVLRVGNLFTNSSWYYSDLSLNPNKYINNGDLIYAWSASFGPRIWQGGHVIFHYHIWKIESSSVIDKHFLYYFLSDERNVLGETDLHGSTMKHITKTNMEHLAFPLPPLSEQKRIVDKIKQLFSIL